ncbi:MAG: PHB depolymerase [Bdellovibrionales bacterium]|jgi:hypothetical protein|nr:PHB depolymerase [Bdellovibrionales bacterium]
MNIRARNHRLSITLLASLLSNIALLTLFSLPASAQSELTRTTSPTFPFPIFFSSAETPPLQELPRLTIDPNRITVSGVSSGAFMAVQLHVAHSNIIKGAASVAGGIWECAKGNLKRSQNVCMGNPKSIQTEEYLDLAKERERRGDIDPLKNLETARIAIFASPGDTVTRAEAADKLEDFYRHFIKRGTITRLTNPTAAHGFPTLAFGNECSKAGVPWMLNCSDDVAGKILRAIDPRIPSARTQQNASSILYFDQHELLGTSANMYSWAAAYIPQTCMNSRRGCGLHIALHGCQMNPDFIQSQFIENSGFNEWAEANHLVILYPQAAKSLSNPYGCWDWFGLTGSKYTSKSGPQIVALRELMTSIGVEER